MIKTKQNIKLPEGTFATELLKFDSADRNLLRDIYSLWRELSGKLTQVHGRKINLPEGLSESAFCLETGFLRMINSIPGANTSFDCFDLKNHRRIQVKSCSVLPDLTSFGPKSKWDDLYFLDFYKDGLWNGEFDIYKIPNDLVYGHKVNAKETLLEQQNQGRRPRFSIYDEIIVPKNIKPLKTGKIY